ncbi:MAG: hypothetical protein ACLF0G_17080 [Candidatus Brocadiia bacterium]
MRSNRAIQTIIQAIALVMLTAIVFKLPSLERWPAGQVAPAGGGQEVDEKQFRDVFREYFEQWNDGEAKNKVQSLSIDVSDVSIEGPIAHVEFLIAFKWTGDNVDYRVGPLKNAPGTRPQSVEYTEVFTFRRWAHRGWDIEGRRHHEEIH